MQKNAIMFGALVGALVLGLATTQYVTAQETATEEETDTEAGIDIREITEEATELFQDGEWESGLELLEKAIEQEPKNYGLVVATAQAYTQYGVDLAQDDRKAANKPLRRGAALMRKIHAEKEELNDQEMEMLSICVYNEACCAAIDENADDAFKLLREAMELGFRDAGLLKNDTDFESVREDERFEEIVAELEEMNDKKRADRRPTEDS
jgi:hypothetical protein